MEYRALYRKYRPQRFAQVIGQDHVTGTLSREIAESRVAHAYLFAGPRGTGKTTTARILAKALNCPDREPAGEPCDSCSSCSAVAGSSSMDVLELDAASHNKVEDIRDLRAGVSTVASVGGARRVFILDEAHMLTKSAGNALLKTLEEPPDHVHFVLATTEPYRLLDTIRSRSQRFDFLLVPTELIAEHLEWICTEEGYRASPEALTAVARRAAGSVRDALSLLEQVAALDGSVTRRRIRDALGVAGPESIRTLVDALVESDARPALELVARLAARGVDLRRFAGDALGFFRGVFLTIYSPDVENITGEPAEVVAGWREASGRLPRSSVMRAIDLLGEALVKLREGREERMMLELSLLKLVRPELDSGSDALLNRVERLERRLSGTAPPPAADGPADAPDTTVSTAGPVTPPRIARPDPVVESAPRGAGRAGTARPPTVSPSRSDGETSAGPPPPAADGPPSLADVERIWPQLIAGVRDELGSPRRLALFQSAIPAGIEDSKLVFIAPDGFHLKQLSSDGELKRYLAKRSAQLLRAPVSVEFRRATGTGAASEPPGPEQQTPNRARPDIRAPAEAPPDRRDTPENVLALLEEELGARRIE